MPVNPSLVQLFGAGATQNATTLTITKTDLQNASWTFTPSATNTAESLFVALLLRTRLNQDISSDSELVISDITQSLVTRNNVRVRRYSVTVEWFVPDSTVINIDGI